MNDTMEQPMNRMRGKPGPKSPGSTITVDAAPVVLPRHVHPARCPACGTNTPFRVLRCLQKYAVVQCKRCGKMPMQYFYSETTGGNPQLRMGVGDGQNAPIAPRQ